jgi:hypothetical protein
MTLSTFWLCLKSSIKHGLIPFWDEVGYPCYLVDPASSHMLVSKIKPCMSKYIPQKGETANGSLNQSWFLRTALYLDNCGNSRANTCNETPTLCGRSAFIRPRPIGTPLGSCLPVVTLDNLQWIARSLHRRRFFQMSALSTVDGRSSAYHGCNG